MPEINYWAVLVSAVAAMVVGAVWYGPLFGKMWMAGMGWDKLPPEEVEKKKKSAGTAYIQQFVGALLTAYVLAHVLWAYSIALPEVVGIAAGLQGAFWLWVGFILPVVYGKKLWEGKRLAYVAVDLGHYLVSLLVMGMILASWM